MKRIIKQKALLMLFVCMMMFSNSAKAQWITFDPGNLAQSIINAAKNIVQTTTTATGMVNNFQETKKLYEQGKQYYDALRSINDLVKDARKVQEIILMVGDISDIYVNSYQLMLHDENFTVEELSAIAYGYTKLLEESVNVLNELKEVVNISTLQMTDKDRIDVIDKCHKEIRTYKNMVNYYTNKNICVSYLRGKKLGETEKVIALYGEIKDRYW